MANPRCCTVQMTPMPPLIPTSNTSPHQRNAISILVKLSISIQCIQKKLYITVVFCEWSVAALRGFSGMPQQRMEGRSGLAELQRSSLLFADRHSELCKRWWSASRKGFKVTAVGEGALRHNRIEFLKVLIKRRLRPNLFTSARSEQHV